MLAVQFLQSDMKYCFFHQELCQHSAVMNPISGFSSTTSQTCQPNYNGNSEKYDGDSVENCQKKVELNKCTTLSFRAERLPGQPYSSRTVADVGNYSGYCSPGWSPLELTEALSEKEPLKPSAFHHCTENASLTGTNETNRSVHPDV